MSTAASTVALPVVPGGSSYGTQRLPASVSTAASTVALPVVAGVAGGSGSTNPGSTNAQARAAQQAQRQAQRQAAQDARQAAQAARQAAQQAAEEARAEEARRVARRRLASRIVGRGGRAVSSVFRTGGALVGGAIGLVGAGVGLAGSVLGAGGSLFGSVLGTIRSLVGGILKMLAVMLRAGLSAVLGVAGSFVKGLANLFSTVLRGALIGLTVAVGALSIGLGKVIAATSDYGHKVNDLSATSGLGARASGGLVSRLGFWGVDAAKTLENQGPAGLAGARAGVWGLPGYGSANYLPSVASRFQSMQGTLTGQLLSRQMLGSQGLDSVEGRRLATTPLAHLREAERFTNRTQAAFGLKPEAISGITRDFDLLSGKIRTLGQTALLAIGQRLIPVLTNWCDSALRIFEHFNTDGGSLIQKGVDLFVSGVGRAFEGMLVFGRFLYATLPAMAYKAADGLLSGLSTAIGALPTLWSVFLKGLDFVQQYAQPVLDWLGKTGASAFDVLGRAALGAKSGIEALITQMPEIKKSIKEIFDSTLSSAKSAVNTIFPGTFSNTQSPDAGAANGASTTGTAGGNTQPDQPYSGPGAGIVNALAIGRKITGPFGAAGRWVMSQLRGDDWLSQGAGTLVGGALGFKALKAGGKWLLKKGATGLLSRLLGGGASGAAGAAGGAGSGASFAPSWMPSWLFNRLPAPLLRAASIPLGGMPTVAGVGSALSVGTVAAGGVLGGLGYTALQRSGLLGDDAPGLFEAAGNVWARTRDFFTGEDPEGNVTQQNGYTASQNAATAAREAAQASGPGARLRGAMGSAWDAASAAYSAPDPWGQIQGMAGREGGRLAQMWNDAPRGSWAQGMDDRFGEGLTRHEQEAQAEIKRMQDALHAHSDLADEDGRGKKYDDELNLLRQIAGNTGQKNDPVVAKLEQLVQVLQGPFAARLIGEVERRRSLSEAAAIEAY